MTIQLPIWAVFLLGAICAMFLPLTWVGVVVLWDSWRMARLRAKVAFIQKEHESLERSFTAVKEAHVRAMIAAAHRGHDARDN